ncbi:MAG TPA: gamma-glutamyl-gamma-aminobutyrate hydrolase family protein, partial [Acidimicrobiales bacterium]
DADLGVLGEWADGRGVELHTVDREDDRLPSLDGCSLVVSLGSVWRIHDPALESVLQSEQELLRRAVADGTPVLAICFGMQQLTVAFGGEVYATEQPEIGFTFIEPRVPAIPRGPWMEYHYDACRLPPGAVALASNGHSLQAYRLGSALAVQFHPEADLAVVKRWSVESADELEGLGLSAAWMVEDAESHAEQARLAALALFDSFWSRR